MNKIPLPGVQRSDPAVTVSQLGTVGLAYGREAVVDEVIPGQVSHVVIGDELERVHALAVELFNVTVETAQAW